MRISDWSSDVCSSDLVLDVKRENFDASAGFRAHYGQQVFLFNPTDRQGRTARYNPLAYIDRSDPADVIIELQKIATMLFTTPERDRKSVDEAKSVSESVDPGGSRINKKKKKMMNKREDQENHRVK